MRRPGPRLRVVASSDSRQLLAMVEAEVGALVEVLPAPLLVTNACGVILRANPAAAAALGLTEASVVGRVADDLLRQRGIAFRMRTLCHQSEVLRLYVW